MRNLVFLLVVFLTLHACGKKERPVELKDLVFRCTVTDADDRNLSVAVNGKVLSYPVPEGGVVEVKVPQIAPQYSSVSYGRKYYIIYLAGGEVVEMKMSGDPDNWERVFEGGCKAINEYLSSGITSFGTDAFAGSEQELLDATEDLIQANVEKMKRCSLPEDFERKEVDRLRYDAYGKWFMYPNSHRWMTHKDHFEPGDLYYRTMEKLAKEDVDLYSLSEYRYFLKNTIPVLVNRGSEEKTPGQEIRDKAKFIVEHYRDTMIVSDLLHGYIYDYVKENGVKGEEEIVDCYKRYVKDEVLLKEFNDVCIHWERLQPGMVSPTFNYVNAEGKLVSLESLRGRYVFIDLWASWCGPCRAEIPYLKKLERTFEGKDIVFVSISCDSSEEAWRKGIQEEKLEGMQLYINGDSSFPEAYVVNSIPRFILLDKEGKIVNANMTKPSNPGTEAFLRGLPGLM